MSVKLQHACIRASAGTGKTYQLANRYLALLLLQSMGGGHSAPEKIVAMTFTRKGAAEFAQRILHRLAVAAGDHSQRKRLAIDLHGLLNGNPELGVLGLAPGVPVQIDEPTLQAALAKMIDHLDRLQLSTIDGFMARSVQTLAFELGLGGFEILEKPAIESERDELLAEVFRTVPSEDLGQFYQTLKLALLKSSVTLRRELDTFVQSYHHLLHVLPDAAAWGGPQFWTAAQPGPALGDWKKEASDLARQIAGQHFGIAQISKALAEALSWIATRTPGSAGSVPSWLKEDGKLTELWGTWPAGDWNFSYYNRVRTVPSAIVRKLRPVLEGWISAECAALSRKTLSIHEVVSRYEALYDQQARRNGRLTFNDLPLLLDDKRGAQDRQEVLHLLAFRWYRRFDHWLLDEFQDTSRVQWQVLQPWIDEAIQDGEGTKSVFVVGDPKQSIYGWRNAEPRLFDELVGQYAGAFSEQIMVESWRSRPSVLALVNRVCDPQCNSSLEDPNTFSKAALTRWKYEEHVAQEKRQSSPGYATVLLAGTNGAEEEDSTGDATEADTGLAETVAAQARVIKTVLTQLRPIERGLSCAILVRKNKTAEAIAQWLRAHDVSNVMVEGVSTLAKQSPVVAALVDALRWLANPSSSFASGHVSLTPLWAVLANPVARQDTKVAPGALWRYWRRRITEVGAPEVTREWCAALAETHREAYALYCLEHVGQLAQATGVKLDLSEWLATLEQLEVRETAAAGSIHIMTIHTAKGLGFDVVFLPDLDSGGGGPDDILIKRDTQGNVVGCLAHPPKWLQAWEGSLRTLCAAQKADQDLEALCVLYVALTRAKEATFVILNEEKPRRSSPARDWILSAVENPGVIQGAPAEVPWGAAKQVWEHGSREFCQGHEVLEPPPVPAPAIKLLPPVARTRRRKPSEAGHEDVASADETSAFSSISGQAFGTAVHAVFEQIRWWTPDSCLSGDPVAIALVRECLEIEPIRELFTCGSQQDEALRELPVEFMEKNTWWSGVMDRLVLRRDDDGVLRKAILIDFKTDRVEDRSVLIDRYAAQLGIYRRAVISALMLEDHQVEVILLSTHLRQIARL